ncbi:MAG: hypothetical protein A2V66_03390 [Ignavibacteria bacterium RBG_13_36_8]|nr:MAG: hypothetical protein A2V66_03390 [Ignavibacteria bacterium RBG_13_36_8]
MFKNYFFLKRCAIELNQVLKKEIILEAYTQERDKLYLLIGNDNLPNRHVVISTNPIIPYVFIKDNHFRAKINTINFFNEYLPAEIKQIDIATNDRIIRITLNSSNIYFIVRGNQTNILLVDNESKVSVFKKSKKNNPIDLRNEVMSLKFTDSFRDNRKDYNSNNLTLPHISKEVLSEIEVRIKSGNKNDFQDIQTEVIHAILKNKIAIFYNNDMHQPMMCPSSFLTYTIPKSTELFNSYNNSLGMYLSIKFRNESISKLKAEIEKYLFRELEKLSSKLNELKKRIDAGSKEGLYKYFGNLLLSNRPLIKKGMKEICLCVQDSKEEIIINLDPKLSPQKNIDVYFDKSRNEKINIRQSHNLYEKIENKYKYLLKIKDEYDNSTELESFSDIKKKLKLNSILKPIKLVEEKIKYRHFLLEGKYNVYVGKDNVNNDLLTTKFAKQNDYWFHARGVSGSHVVLRVNNQKENIPKNILKNVASIAAFYSKSKTSSLSPVSYTFRKYVHKKKGLEPGKVILSKENVVIVKPEIPKNCELLDE